MPTKVAIQGTFYSVEEAATALGLAIDSVRRYCNMKPAKIKAEKLGRDWAIPKSEIDRYRREKKMVGRPSKSA